MNILHDNCNFDKGGKICLFKFIVVASQKSTFKTKDRPFGPLEQQPIYFRGAYVVLLHYYNPCHVSVLLTSPDVIIRSDYFSRAPPPKKRRSGVVKATTKFLSNPALAVHKHLTLGTFSIQSIFILPGNPVLLSRPRAI